MQKSFRTLVAVAVLSLVAAPSMLAETMGCNPRPKSNVTAPVSPVETFAYTVMALLGV